MFFSGERLKAAREFYFKTIDRLIQALDNEYGLKVNKGTVSRWENGKIAPRVDAVDALAKCLKVPTEYLLGVNNPGCIMTELRLKSGLTVEELSEISEVDRHIIVLTEGLIDFPRNNGQLERIGKALGIDNLRDYIEKKGYKGPLTYEDYEKIKQNEERHSHKNQADLFSFLEETKEIRYKNRLLTSNEISKIQRIVEITLDEK